MKQISIIILFLIINKIGHAQQGPVWEWSVDSNIVFRDIKYSNGSIFGVGDEQLGGVLIKKDTTGSTQWKQVFSGIVFQHIEVSNNDDIYGLGWFSGTIMINGINYTSNGAKDLIVIGCDSIGNLIFVKTFGSVGDDYGIDLCVDKYKNVYVAAICTQAITMAGYTFSGSVIAKFTNAGNPVFLHSISPTLCNTSFSLVSIKYNKVDSTINIVGNYALNATTCYLMYNHNGIQSSFGTTCGFNCGNIFTVRLNLAGNLLSFYSPTSSNQGGSKTFFTTDAAINGNGIFDYSERYQYTLNGYTYNSFGSLLLSSNCTFSQASGQPLKMDCDAAYYYGTVYQPNLVCNEYNCTSFYALKGNGSTAQSTYYLSFWPSGITGHNEVFYLGSYNGGLYKLCNNCNTPLTIEPLADITACTNSVTAIPHGVCQTIQGGTAPYTYQWQPSTWILNPTSASASLNYYTPPGSYSYTLTVTDANGNFVKDTININKIQPSQIVTALSPSSPSCGVPFTITASGFGSLNFYVPSQGNYPNTNTLTTTLNASTTIYISGTDSNGCIMSSNVSINLPSNSTYQSVNVCSNDLPYQWNGLSLTNSGQSHVNFTNTAGCDSVAFLNLNVINVDTTHIYFSKCVNQMPYIWNGHILNDSGTYIFTYPNLSPNNGCDSIVIVRLNVSPMILNLNASNPTLCGINDSTTLSVNYSTNYCTPYVKNNNGPRFNGFHFNGVDLDTISTLPYFEYAPDSVVLDVVAGHSYNVFYSSNQYNDKYITFWFDINRDGDFMDTGEYWYNIPAFGYSNNEILTIPPTAVNGVTRMRLGIKSYPAATWPTSCLNELGGQYIDYNIRVTGGNNHITWSPSLGLSSIHGDSIKASPNTTTTYTVTIVNSAGCTSDSSITINVNLDTTSSNITVCNSQLPYNWYGNSITTDGIYYHVLQNSNGCDSILKLYFTVQPSQSNTTNLNICQSALPYLWYTQSVSGAGTYSQSFINQFGCDSTEQIVVSILPIDTTSINISVCPDSNGYNWNGMNLSSTGIYYYILQNGNGCDSALKLYFTVQPSQSNTTNLNICQSALPYLWYTQSVNGAGTYSQSFINQSGCDSTEQIVVTIIPNDTTSTYISVCPDSNGYNWNGMNLSSTGIYYHILLNGNGCDSVLKLYFTVQPSQSNTTNLNICQSALPYLWYTQSVTGAGTYSQSFINQSGCDSTEQIVVTIIPNDTTSSYISACPDSNGYNWNGMNLTNTGIYYYTLQNINGCDSVLKLNFMVQPSQSNTTNLNICQSALPYLWYTQSVTGAGTYSQSFINQSGCDSTEQIVVTIIPNDTTSTYISVCPDSNGYNWNGMNLSSTGIYYHIFQNGNGCDSVLKLYFTVQPSQSNTTNLNICQSALPYLWYTQSVTGAGMYSQNFINQSGCDSTEQIVVTIVPEDTTSINISVCPDSNGYNWNGMNLTNTGIYYYTLQNINGCDSVLKLYFTVQPSQSNTTNLNICQSALPYLWYTQSVNGAGTYSQSFINQSGCDSTEQIVVTIIPNDTTSTYISVCPDSNGYNWNGMNLSSTGIYNYTTINSLGCDSVSIINFSIFTANSIMLVFDGTLLSIPAQYNSYQWYFNGNIMPSEITSTLMPTLNGDYYCEVIDSNGCVILSQVFNLLTIVVNDFPDFTIVPNPADRFTTIYFQSSITGKIQLINLVGQVVLEEEVINLSEVKMDLNYVAQGIYILLFELEQGRAFAKLQVK